MHLAVYTVGSLVEHHGKYTVGLLCHFVHLTNLFGINTCRFLTHHMQIMLKCVNTQFRMLIMWNSDQNCITYILCCDQIFSFFKNLYVLWKILFAPLAAAFLAVCHSSNLNLRYLSVHQILCMARTHVTHTNNTKSYLFHEKPLLLHFR